MRDAPKDVASIVGILTREGYDTLKNNFTILIDSAECEFNNVAVGTWHLQVNAYDGSNSLKYSGNTDVQVFAGQTTPVRLTLDTASGSIYVTVAWGSGDTTGADMALKFAGINGKVDFSPSSVLQPKNITVELKVMFNSTSQFQPILVEQVPDLWNTASGFEITYEKGRLCFQLAQSSIYRAGPIFSFIPVLNKWVDIACTYDGDSIRIYTDGILDTSEVYNTPVYYDASVGFSLGYAYHSYYGGANYFSGAMDGLRIWNYALTQEQIDTSMNNKLTGNEPGLVGYWDFNQKTSDAYALDRTGNGNNGQLVGGVQFVPISFLNN